MSAITLRGLPPEVERLVRRTAAQKKISVNRAVALLLSEKTGLSAHARAVVHDDLDHLAGRWSRSEARRFDRFLSATRTVDPELWK